ncbi:MAG: hypothetical protein RIQ60_2270 [Pseudomonadota bacterium]|jgi:hypothetical protein
MNSTLQHRRPPVRRWATGLILAGLSLTAQAAFHITLDYTGSWTAAERDAFGQAASFWESVITGYQPTFVQDLANVGAMLGGITITATSAAIDGVGGVLGSGGPTAGWTTPHYVMADTGAMSFDSADLSAMQGSGLLPNVAKHEMGHVLGIGTLWTANGVYVNGSGQYTGANALAAYRAEYNQPQANFVPVELGGGPGTSNAHWNEVDGGLSFTGIVNGQGLDFRDELMTGWILSGAPVYVSRTTVASLADIGYTVTAVPEPGMWLMLSVGSPLLMLRRRRLPAPT